MDVDYQTSHIGNNIKRLRELKNLKQEDVAALLNMSQQTFSKLEAKEKIDDEMLEKVAKVLKVPVEAIKNFSEEATINLIIETVNSHDNSFNNAFSKYYHCTFNPIDKLMEIVDENRKLHEENKSLLERLLEAEKAKNKK